MSSVTNRLGLPVDQFGQTGICVGNLVSAKITTHDPRFKPQYNSRRNRITILNTSDLPLSVLYVLLKETSYSTPWYSKLGWYPAIAEKRTSEGNLEIFLSRVKPDTDGSTRASTSTGASCSKDDQIRSSLGLGINILGLPIDIFGKMGIIVGNILSRKITTYDERFTLQYDSNRNRIIINNTSESPWSPFYELLNDSLSSYCYDKARWYPVIAEERNNEGNLEIFLSRIKPDTDDSTRASTSTVASCSKDDQVRSGSGDRMREFEHEKSFFKGTETAKLLSHLRDIDNAARRPKRGGFSILYDTRYKTRGISCLFTESNNDWNVMASSTERPSEVESFSPEEVIAMEQLISERVISAMKQFFNRHETSKGIWYPDDYKKYLNDECNQEMDESFYSGFANENFFEKTGFFTFKLKDGVKASEALLSFLEGPTIADCGNATMACYYKCLLDILGEEKFDQLFNSEPYTLMIGQNGITDTQSPISLLADFTESAKQKETGVFGKRPIKIGEEYHFGGVTGYQIKHPDRFESGWNVIYVGDNEEGHQLFIAHGFEKPLTEREINRKFIEAYCRERTPRAMASIKDAEWIRLHTTILTAFLSQYDAVSSERIEKTVKGFLIGSVRGLNAKSMIRLKNASNIRLTMLNLIKEEVDKAMKRRIDRSKS